MLRLFKPEIYQGNKRLKTYFEGWYFKQVNDDETRVFSFIPGISLNPSDPHSFIQFIDGITGETHYTRYDINDFTYSRNRFEVRVGNSFFSKEKIILDLKNQQFTARGELNFSETRSFPSTVFSPGIMGWYSFVPFMECKHGVVSMNHYSKGKIQINGEAIDFNRGKSYIEKDWGRSFPAAWIWLQSNNFPEPEASIMMSVAKIPWLGNYFMGFIAFLYLKGETYLFSTYNQSKLELESYDDEFLKINLSNKKNKLGLNIERRKAGELVAPKRGKMSRMIKESVDSVIHVQLSNHKDESIYEGTGKRAGLEVTSNIFELLEE